MRSIRADGVRTAALSPVPGKEDRRDWRVRESNHAAVSPRVRTARLTLAYPAIPLPYSQ